MSFDGFFTHAMVNELKEQLLGGSIKKIYQPFEQEIHLQIRSRRQNYRLLASIHPTYYRIHLSDEKPSNPEHAPMFTMVLRKHIENSQILNIQQIENDRIIEFELTGRDELGDQRNYRLIFELMGRHSNILLVDANKNTIIDCIKHVSGQINSYRGLQPGCQYVRPPRNENQSNIMTMDQEALMMFAEQHAELLQSEQAGKVIQGMSKIAAQQISFWINHENLSEFQALKLFIDGIKHPFPSIINHQDKLSFYAFNLSYLQGQKESFKSLSKLVETYYFVKVHSDRMKQLSGDIIQKINSILEKDHIKLNKLAEDQIKADDSELYRIYGELLSAYSHQVQKGLSSIDLPNYYDDNQLLSIPLLEHKNAIENSQYYFKKYSKYKDSLKYIEEQRQMTYDEINYLEGILVQLHQADYEDIESIKVELMEQGYIHKQKNSIKKRATQKINPRVFKSTEGVPIYVGRNNVQNDTLSLKKSPKNHWWLHAKNIPGAHVIVSSDKPSQQTMIEAAEIAAYYSRSQNSANVPVDAVQIQKLKKPNGAKPGFVIYEGQETYYVTPHQETIESKMLPE